MKRDSHSKNSTTIAVASGKRWKGGVGKTSVAIKLSKTLVERKVKRVLLIDCDYNLSNTAFKLGFPLSR